MKKLGLYIHIPFCARKCNYCDFYSLPHSQEREEEYITALCNHIRCESNLYKNCEFDTVYLGGGTPSVLSVDSITRLVQAVKECLNLTQGGEFTVEVNPCSVTKEKLVAYKALGINRLSMGVQSANDTELTCLGRLHTKERAQNAFLLARECGFDNISLDLMFGLPDQGVEDFRKSIDFVLSLSPEHISAYGLKIEKNTPFGRAQSSLSLPTEDEECAMYDLLCDALLEKGYEQYEISNFSKIGYRARHNVKYWLAQEYVGFGPSAHSYFDGVRYYYESDVDMYISGAWKKIKEDGSEPSDPEKNEMLEKMDEYVMLRLRLCDGVDEGEFEAVFQSAFISEYPKIANYVKSGHVTRQNGKFAFTKAGFFVSNYILSDILH